MTDSSDSPEAPKPEGVPPVADAEPGANSTESKWLALLFGGISLLYVGVIYTFERGVKPPTPELLRGKAFAPLAMDGALGACALIGFLGLLAYGALRRYSWMHSRHVKRASAVVLALLLVASMLVSFWGRKVHRKNWTQMWDTYHYALGPKYFPELSYFDLYDCTVDALNKKYFKTKKGKKPGKVVKDLRTYGRITYKEAKKRKCLETKFEDPERREEFVRDIRLFGKMESGKRIVKMMGDHGYNGAPFHATLSGTIARAFELTPNSLPMLATIDGVGLFIMLFVIARMYGWRAGLVFALFFLTHVVDRNKSIGASFIRYSWMISLGIGIACLHRKKMGWGAFWLVAASMLNVFPLLFGLGVMARGVADWIREKRMNEHFKRFIVVGMLATGGLGLAAGASGRGVVGSYQEFFEDMRVHSDGPPDSKGNKRERIPGFGLGLKFMFMYRGEHKRGSKAVSKKVKSKQYREIKPLVQGLGLFMTLLALGVATRLAYAEAAILVGFVAFYSLLGTVAYYFTCASLVWLIWHTRRRRAGGYLMALAFWGISLFGYYGWLTTESDGLLFATILSSCWFFYIWLALGYLGWDTGLWRDLSRFIAAPAADPEPTESEDAPAAS